MRILLRDLTPGTDYNIQLRSNDGTNVSEWSRVFPMTTVTDTLAPAPVQNVTWVVNRSAFSGKWDAVTQNEDATPLMDFSHYIVRIQSGVTYRDVKTTNTFYDLPFETNKAFFGTPQATLSITVFAVDTTGNFSDASATVSATNPPPPDPTGVVAAGIVGGISMRWDVQSIDDLAAYDVYMSTTGAGFTPSNANRVYSGTGNTLVYDSSSLGVVHYFKIRSRDVFDSISNYVTVSATPISPTDVDTTAPGVPTGLTATMAVDTNDSAFATAAVSWTAPSDTDLAGYVVRYKQNSSTTYDYVNVPVGTTSITIGGLVVGVQYNFSVQAFDRSTNRSAFSSAVNATAANTAPSTPAAPVAVANIMSVQVSHSLQKSTSGRLEADVAYFEVHLGTTSTFTADDTTLIGQLQVEPGSTFVSEIFSAPAPDSSLARWVRVIAVDRGGLKSSASAVAAVTVGLISNAYIANATITSAKIASLEANKITAGTGIINALLIKNSLTVDTGGTIKSTNYVAGSTGYQLSNNTLEINGGTIRAAALLLQDAPNIILPQYSDFEFQSTWYTGKTVTFNDGGTTSWAIATAPEVTPKFGTQCLKHTWTGGGTFSRVYQGSSFTDYNVIVEPNTDYIASVWVFNPTGSGDKTVGFGVKMGDGATYPQPGGTPIVVANGTWTRISGTFNTGANSTLMTYMSLYTAGSVYFDGLQIERKLTGSTTPSPWRAPSTTSIDGGIIRTGEIRSTALANGLSGQPAWSINMTGGAQFGDATVRGRIVVGDPSNPTADGVNSRIHSANYVAGTSGWIIRNDGYAEFRNLAVNSIKVTALDAPMQNNTYAKLFDYMQDGSLWLSHGAVVQKTDPGAYSAESLFEFTGSGLVLRNAVGVTKVAYDPTILYRISARIRAYSVATLNSNPGFETNTTGWFAYGTNTITRDTTKKFSGVASVRWDQAGTSNGSYGMGTVVPVKAGYTYTFSARMLPNSTVIRDNLKMNIVWKDAANATISTTFNDMPPPVDANGVVIPIDGTTWSQFSSTGTAPTGAVSASFEIQAGISGSPVAGIQGWFDDVTVTTPPRIKVGLFGFDNANNIIDWDYVDDATTPTKKHAMPTDYSLLSGYAANQYMMVQNNSEVQIATGSSGTTADWITVTGYVRGRGGAGATGVLGTQGEHQDPYSPASLNQSVRYLVPYVEWDIATGSVAQLDQFSIEAYENGAPAKVATTDVNGQKAVSVENIQGSIFDHAIRFYTGEPDEQLPGMVGHVMDGDWNDASHIRISPPLINKDSDYGGVFIGIYDRNPNYIYDATFEDGITGWSGMANTTLSHETTIGREDTNSLKITATGTISSPATTELLGKYSVSTLTNQELIGQKVTVTGYAMMGTATGRNVRLVVKFMDEAGAMINGYFIEKAVTNTAWVNFSFISPIVIPDTCYSVEFSFSWFNGATGDIVYIDDVQLEMGTRTDFRTASASKIMLQSDYVKSNGGIIISRSELDLPDNVWGSTVGGRRDTPFYPGVILQSEGGTGAVRYVNYTDSAGNRASTQLTNFSPSGVEEHGIRFYGMNDATYPGRWVLTNATGQFVMASYANADEDMTTARNVRVYGHLDVDGDPPWEAATLQTGSAVAGAYTPSYFTSNGTTYLRGAASGWTKGSGTPIFTLPSGYRPTKTVYLSTVSYTTTSDAQATVLVVDTAGKVYVYSAVAAKTNVMLDGLSFSNAPDTYVTPPTGDTTAPGTPSGFKITALSSSTTTGTYRLNWTNPSASDTAGVKIIWRSDRYPTVTIAASGTKTLTTDGKIITVTGAASAAKQYDHSGLPVNKTIYYRVVSYDSSGNHSTYVSASRYLLASPVTVTASSSDSYRLGYGGMWRNDGDEVYQGDWTGNDNHRGMYFYGTKIYDALAAGGVVRTPTKATIYLKRLSTAHGNNTGVGINLRGHVYQTKPSGDPVGGMTNEGSDGDDIVFLSRGEAATVTIPSSWYNNIVDATAANRIEGFGVYGSGTGDYAVMYGVSSGSSYGKITLYHKG
ncbi:minor tail protein [Streptomyces phage StarPlatinum]|uniref:Minor tail protein n=1 Tax=Streptomyces phage StarPlatinum TaxID=2283265 RepID=A0A345M8J3_9CAUD|nr:minor tail protein [Streptomyces phage StarPlatinum]AXH66814.1 minor tail protein [Streptomyces phage StarPlatinum]